MDSCNPTDGAGEPGSQTIYTIYGLISIPPHHLYPYVQFKSTCKHTLSHIITKKYMPHIPYASPLVHTIWTFSPSLRICRGKAWLCRVNVNVLTPLPKIRAAPALVSPLNYNPVSTVSTSILASSALWAAGYLVPGEGFLGMKIVRRTPVVLFYLLYLTVSTAMLTGCTSLSFCVLF